MKEPYRYLAIPRMAAPTSVPAMMLDVIVALLPALGMSVYLFGFRVLLVTLLSMSTCLLFQYLYGFFMRRSHPTNDPSALVTGLLLAFCYPVEIPLWGIPVGSFFAIIVVKELYGGLGRNFINPALAGRMFLASSPNMMNTFVRPVPMEASSVVDVMSGATPMAFLHRGEVSPITLEELVLGFHASSLGEGSALMLLLGGVYLLLRRVISPMIPASFLGTVAVLCYVFPKGDNASLHWMFANLFSGGLILGAVFMATDPVTSPTSPKGQLYYGIGCGVFTVLLRYFGSYPEGVGFALLLMNGLVWVLEYIGVPRLFSGEHFAIPKRGYRMLRRHLRGVSFQMPVKMKKKVDEVSLIEKEKAEKAEKEMEKVAEKIVDPSMKKESKQPVHPNGTVLGENFLDEFPTPVKLVLSYGAVLVVTILSIAVTHSATQLQTHRTEELRMHELLASAMPQADFLSESPYASPHFETLYFAYEGQKHLGYCIEVSSSGFAGDVRVLVGVTTGGAVTGIAVLDHSETLHIGSAVLESQALKRFVGRSGTLSLWGNNAVDGISGATVTLEAVTDCVNQALQVVQLIDQTGGLELLDGIL